MFLVSLSISLCVIVVLHLPYLLYSVVFCSFLCFLIFCPVFTIIFFFFFSSRRRHTRCLSDWSSDVCSSDLASPLATIRELIGIQRPNAIQVANGEADCEKLWVLRRQFSNSLRATGLTKDRKSVV